MKSKANNNINTDAGLALVGFQFCLTARAGYVWRYKQNNNERHYTLR